MYSLHYAPMVVSIIYHLREKGVVLREELKRLEQNPRIENARVVPGWENRYEFEVLGLWVLIEVLEDQQVIRILNIEAIT